jgi:type VI secretion system protein ImpA
MASADVVDFAKLLAPIAGENPTGTDLRKDPSPVSDFWMLRGDRDTARQSESRYAKGADRGENEPPPPDWRPLIARATRILTEKSKDLEVTAFLIEGLTREHGFAGLRDGMRAARELLERYWDGLFPIASGSDGETQSVEERFSHLLQLNGIDGEGTLIVPIRKIPFTEKTNSGRLSLSHHQLALSLDKISDAKVRQKRIDDGAITLEKIKAAVAETPASFYVDLLDDVNQSQEEFRKCCAVLKEKSGYDPPSSDLLRGLEEYVDIVKDLAKDKLPKPEAVKPTTTTNGPEGHKRAGESVEDPSIIKNREDALERLVKIADYFRTNEPQSIIPFAIQQVVSWGRMPLPDLLAELIPEEGARKGFFKQVGIRPGETKK